MKKTYLTIILLAVNLNGVINAGEFINEAQKQAVVSSIMNQARESWIPSGTIEAIHRHFDYQADEVITTLEKIDYQDGKFRWEIDIESYKSVSDNQKRKREIDAERNRVFIWDGNQYMMYFKSAKNAVITEDVPNMPVSVNGPLKAGIVPWGHGIFKLDTLSPDILKMETLENSNIRMVIEDGLKYSIELELDPEKDYAVVSNIIEFKSKSQYSNSYSGYKKFGDLWIPSKILTEKSKPVSGSWTVESSDLWEMTNIDLTECQPIRFRMDYDDDVRVEHRVPGRTLSYRYKSGRNTQYMLAHRNYNAANEDRDDHNCATAAITYVAMVLGKEINPDDFTEIINGTEKTTSFFEMIQFLKSKGLNCSAITSGITSLASMKDCNVILHLAQSNHYVILDHIDEKYVWLIDLDSDRFYYRLPVEEFISQWSGRSALVVSDAPFTPPAGSEEIPESRLHEIKGAAESFGTYSCTDLIQEYSTLLCGDINLGGCKKYIIWYNRYACELDSQGGYCVGDKLVSHVSSKCVESMTNPGDCTVVGDWHSRYMHACK